MDIYGDIELAAPPAPHVGEEAARDAGIRGLAPLELLELGDDKRDHLVDVRVLELLEESGLAWPGSGRALGLGLGFAPPGERPYLARVAVVVRCTTSRVRADHT